MLYYDKIDISKGIDPNKSYNHKECVTCHCLFFNHGFKFQGSIWKSGHDLTILSLHINDIAIITAKNIDYHCISHKISKYEAINLLKDSTVHDGGYIHKLLR